MAIIDVITYHNEVEMFDLRYNMLKDHVDQFVVVESVTTFGGLPKLLTFPKDKYDKVKYYVNEDKFMPEEIDFAMKSQNTGGLQRWAHEFLQKESIQKAITHLNDEDTVYIGDVDEIWNPDITYDKLTKIKLRVYAYYLNYRSSEEFWGPIVAKYKDIKGQCLNHLRNNGPNNSEDYGGWHFTNIGGYDAVKMKVFDQYNPEVFGEDTWLHLTERFGKTDYVGRNFEFKEDESEWPQYLKDNKVLYKHLCK